MRGRILVLVAVALLAGASLCVFDGDDETGLAKGSGHHREAVVVFPPITQRGTVRMVVRNVGGIGERVFVWE